MQTIKLAKNAKRPSSPFITPVNAQGVVSERKPSKTRTTYPTKTKKAVERKASIGPSDRQKMWIFHVGDETHSDEVPERAFFSVDKDVVCLQDMIENTLSTVSNHLAVRAEALKLALRCINRYKVARGIANSRILGSQSGRRRAEEQLARALACLANALESDGFNTKRFSSHRVKMHQDGLRHRKLVGFASHPAHWKQYSHLLLSR